MKNLIFRLALSIFLLTNSQFSTISAQNVEKKTNVSTETIHVSGNCEDCKRRIEKACFRMAGVTKADWNDETQLLTVTFNPQKTTTDKIEKSIAKFGYDTAHHKGADKAYAKLPHCCQYREGNPHKEQ